MKKILYTIVFLMTIATYSQIEKNRYLKSDSIYSEINILSKQRIGRFELYPTTNRYTFIKLDTSTGMLWQVQWSTEAKTRFTTELSDVVFYDFMKVVEKDNQERNYKRPNGRFKLYPTTNIYNFILLDRASGTSWQVQWNIKKELRQVHRIDW